MDWFYALNKQQQGPVDSATLRALFQGGTINAETLVWHAGLDAWKPYTEIATSLEAAPAGDLPDFMTGAAEPAAASAATAPAAAALAPQDMATCAHSGRVAPKKDMLQYGEHWLIPENKDAFIAALQQGTAVMPGDVRTNMISVGFWWRVLAMIIDSLIYGVGAVVCFLPAILLGGIPIITSMIQNGGEPDPDVLAGSMVTLVIGFILSIILIFAFLGFYYIYLVGKNGGTPGKRILGFLIVNADGTKVSYGKAAGRFFATMAMTIAGSIVGSILIFLLTFLFSMAGETAAGIGLVLAQILNLFIGNATYLWVAFDKEKRGLHDLIASTRVVRG